MIIKALNIRSPLRGILPFSFHCKMINSTQTRKLRQTRNGSLNHGKNGNNHDYVIKTFEHCRFLLLPEIGKLRKLPWKKARKLKLKPFNSKKLIENIKMCNMKSSEKREKKYLCKQWTRYAKWKVQHAFKLMTGLDKFKTMFATPRQSRYEVIKW